MVVFWLVKIYSAISQIILVLSMQKDSCEEHTEQCWHNIMTFGVNPMKHEWDSYATNLKKPYTNTWGKFWWHL